MVITKKELMSYIKRSANQLKNLELGRQPKFDEPKTTYLTCRLTEVGKKGFQQLSQEFGLKPADLIELLSRGEFEVVRKTS